MICLLCVLTKKRVPRPRQLGRSSPFPRGPGSAEITKADVARNASNEGTAARTTTKKTVWYRIVRMVDLWEVESQGRWHAFLLDGDVRCVPYLACDVHVDEESQAGMQAGSR